MDLNDKLEKKQAKMRKLQKPKDQKMQSFNKVIPLRTS